jgi:hypothetical protein
MNLLALVAVLSSAPGPQSSLEQAVRACGMQSGDKVTLGVTLAHGKVKSVRTVFKNVAEQSVRECVVGAARAHEFGAQAPERFTLTVSI